MTREKEHYSSFIEACLNGTAEPCDINQYVDYWHEHDGDLSLREFLGMTVCEYQVWGESSVNVIEDILYCRREGINFLSYRNHCSPSNRYFIYENHQWDPPTLIAYADSIQQADMKCREFDSAYYGFGVKYSYQKNPKCTDCKPELDDINYQPEQQSTLSVPERIQIGDVLKFPQLYSSGTVTVKVVARTEDTVTVTEIWRAETEVWRAEDTEKWAHSTEEYKIEKDAEGRERINVWQYDNCKCYAVPEPRKPVQEPRKTAKKGYQSSLKRRHMTSGC